MPMVVDEYPLSPIQEGMLFHHLSEVHSGVDVEQIVIDYEDRLNIAALEKAWQIAVDRHPVLRTAFRLTANGARQQVLDSVSIHIDHRADFSEELFAEFIATDRTRGFDLAAPPLTRVTVFDTTPGCSRLVWTVHHIVLDGRSFVLVLNEVEQLYRKILRGEEISVEAGLPYRPYIEWLGQLDLAAAKQFWAESLRGISGPTPLLADPEAGGAAGGRYGEQELRLSEPLTTRLREIAREHGITLNTIVMGVWGILLSVYSREKDVLFGATKTTRRGSVPNAESIVGLFLNTVPVRLNTDPEKPVLQMLAELRTEWLNIREHEHLPLVAIREAAGLPASTPLFDSLVVFENQRFDTALAASGEQWRTRSCRLLEQTNFSLTFLAYGDPAMLLKLEFDARKFTPATAERILSHARRLFEAIAENPSEKIGKLRVLPENELKRLLIDWNATGLEYPRATPLAQLVEAQVERTPDAVAVIYEQQSIPYRELNERANQLAWELQKHGAGPDVLVGLCVERSIDMMTALLAIVKSGAAYVPLDPWFPADRLAYMIQDSELPILLTQRSLLSSVPQFNGVTIAVDGAEWRANRRDNPGIDVTPDKLAYVLYTSGSTGRPKGVLVPRGALTNLLWSMRDWLQLTKNDRLLAITTISFDIAGLDIWLPWLVGATTVLASRESAADGAQLRSLLDRHDVTFLQATPVSWWLLLGAGWRGKANLQIVCTGEAMPQELAAQLQPIVRRLWNLYGPTETTIWSTGYQVERGNEPILIGRPVANTQCYILDDRRQPVPLGAIGELYIAGDGLARGYLKRPDLTAEKFVPNLFSDSPGARMYRTGDLARYRSDGNIECLGRTDHQVKIRGFRIELGEIEAVLKEHEAVKQAVVVAREDTPGNKRLVAYVVPAQTAGPAPADLRKLLKQRLPEYMVPADYVTLASLPISPNGKIDRKALPAPVVEERVDAGRESTPRTETERRVASIFCGVLALKSVGIDDDFFDLGGHSLTAMQAIAQINREFSLDLPVRVLFQAQTTSQLAAIIDSRKGSGSVEEDWTTLIPIQPKGTRPPLFCVARPNVNALGFLFLSRELGADQPVYGLQSRLDEDPTLGFSQEQYEATAAVYIQAMRTVQPEGPYYLTGFCQGSFLAFEITRQLEAQGQLVALLAILDTWTEENTRRKWLYRLSIVLDRLRQTNPRRAWAYIRRRMSAAPSHSAATHPSGFPPISELYWPGPSFKPPVCSARIVVFRTARQEFFRIQDDTLGWRGRSSTAVETDSMPGGHTTFLREPHVRVLAQKLAARMDAARAWMANLEYREATEAIGR